MGRSHPGPGCPRGDEPITCAGDTPAPMFAMSARWTHLSDLSPARAAYLLLPRPTRRLRRPPRRMCHVGCACIPCFAARTCHHRVCQEAGARVGQNVGTSVSQVMAIFQKRPLRRCWRSARRYVAPLLLSGLLLMLEVSCPQFAFEDLALFYATRVCSGPGPGAHLFIESDDCELRGADR